MEGYNPFGKPTIPTQEHTKTNSAEQTAPQDSSPYSRNQESPGQSGQVTFPQFGETKNSGASERPISDTDDLQKKIEAAKSNGWGAHVGSFLNSNKKRMALLAVAVLLFGVGFYAYNKNGGDSPAQNLAAISDIHEPEKTQSDSNTDGVAKNESLLAQTLDLKLDENGDLNLEENGDSTPTIIQDSNSVITKSARAGEGITHLARYAIRDYLTEQGTSLTAEQKIYAEDYAQNAIGSESLEIGQKISFSKTLLKEAIEKAEGLEAWQLENLKQYTAQTSLL